MTSPDNLKRRNRISFGIFILAFALGIAGWVWLRNQPKDAMGTKKTLRTVLNKNEDIFEEILSDEHLAKTYPKEMAAKKARVNGNVGMGDDFNPDTWKLKVVKANGDTLRTSLEEIKKLPKIEYTFNFKCIEGWSQITNWGGVKFSDFVEAYGLEEEAKLAHTALLTPDGKYYVGIDQPSMMHPQTILCYELNGEPIPMNQGYPLRLMIPVKYGVKSLKRIGTIYFSDERPPDYWAEKGYDYYIGL